VVPYYARSGTSFSAPMVTGVVARMLSEDDSLYDTTQPAATEDKVFARLRAAATRLDNAAANLGSTSTNLYLYAGGISLLTQPASTIIGSGDSAALSTSLATVGLSPSYQLYQGTTGNTNTPVGLPQTSGSFTVTPSGTTNYW